MPYIHKDRRQELDKGQPAEAPGDLAYLVATLVDDYIADNGKSFQSFSEAVAALEQVKFELNRRVIAKYEDGKLLDNGDVWTVA